MPYIRPDHREEIDPQLNELLGVVHGEDPGLVNYLITKIVDYCIDTSNYRGVNTAIGILECAKLEFYRRIAAPYEDVKMFENGDVY